MTLNLKDSLKKLTKSNFQIYSYDDLKDFCSLWGLLVETNPNFTKPIVIVSNGLLAKISIDGETDTPNHEESIKEIFFDRFIQVDAWLAAYLTRFLKDGADKCLKALPVYILHFALDNKYIQHDYIEKFANHNQSVEAKLDRCNLKWMSQFFYSPSNMKSFCEAIGAADRNITYEEHQFLKDKNELKRLLFETPEESAKGDNHKFSFQLGALIMQEGLNHSQAEEKFPKKMSEQQAFQNATSVLINSILLDSDSIPFKPYTPSFFRDLYVNDSKLKTGLVQYNKYGDYKIALEGALGSHSITSGGLLKILRKESLDKIDLLLLDLPDIEQMDKAIKDKAENDQNDPVYLKLLILPQTLTTDEKNEIELPEMFKERFCEAQIFTSQTKKGSSSNSKSVQGQRLIKEWIEKKSHRALTVIPLIIRQLHPSLPIILFSSTQHRGVVNRLNQETSIITSFARPYIGGYDQDAYDPLFSIESFYYALDEAMHLVPTRRAWMRVNKELPEKVTLKLKWSKNWNAINISKTDLLEKLEKTWLTKMQKGDFSFAAADCYFLLVDLLGGSNTSLGQTRLSIATYECNSDPVKNYLDFLLRTKNSPTLDALDGSTFNRSFNLSGEEANDTHTSMSKEEFLCRLAITAVETLIALLNEWSKGNNDDK